MLHALFTSDLRGGIHSLVVPSFRLFWSSGSGPDIFSVKMYDISYQDTFGSVLN
jgi:hypothetical protein